MPESQNGAGPVADFSSWQASTGSTVRVVACLMSVAFLAAACSGPASRTFDMSQFHTMLNQEMPPSTGGDTAPCTGNSVVKAGYGAIIRGCSEALSALR